MTEAIRRPAGDRLRLTPFRAGVIAGALLPPMAWLAVEINDLSPNWRPPPSNVQVLSNGADISRHGGVKLVVSGERRSMVQTCNGPCDDIVFQTNSRGDDVFRVKVLGASGNCIACDGGQYVTSGNMIARWLVAGVVVLFCKVSILGR